MDATPRRTIRIADPLWEAAKEAAGLRGESVSDVVREALQEYICKADHAKKQRQPVASTKRMVPTSPTRGR